MEKIWHLPTPYIWLAIILSIIIWFIIISFNRVPKWLQEVILYLNMKPAEIGEATVSYSKFLHKWKNLKWNYVYTGREKGQEIVMGNFSIDGRYFYFFSYKTTVKPMIITNTDDKFDELSFSELKNNGNSYYLYTSESFLAEKIKNSPDFLISISRIFPGRNNWLEFTDLNQVILVTDYDFDDHQKMLQLMADFVQIKEKL